MTDRPKWEGYPRHVGICFNFCKEGLRLMEEDYILEESDVEESEEVPDQDFNLDLSIDMIGNIEVRSVVDIVNIPIFTDRFVSFNRTSSITKNEVFTQAEISSNRVEPFNREQLFQQDVLVTTNIVPLEEDEIDIMILGVAFILLGCITFLIMNWYLKKSQKRGVQS